MANHEFVEHADAAGLLDKHDQQEIKKLLESDEVVRDQQCDYHEGIRVLARKVCPDFDKAMSKAMSVKDRCGTAAAFVHKRYSRWVGRSVPVHEQFAVAEVADCVPPGALLYRHHVEARWMIRSGDDCRCRSWAMYGYRESCMILLRWAWAKHLLCQGMDVIDCPIVELFKKRTGNIDTDRYNISMETMQLID